MNKPKIIVEGREYFHIPDYVINDLINKGELVKAEVGYKWSEKNIKRGIKHLKHLYRYLTSPLYRAFVKIIRMFKK